MCILLDNALDQWNSLVEREENIAYRVQPSSSTDQKDGPPQQEHTLSEHNDFVHSCPALWREKICEWCYEVIDYFDIDRDVVSIALFYFDRYLSFHTPIAESLFQLVAMTSLYLAVKVHSTRKISVAGIVSLSKGSFREDQILKMEICIIKTLHWHVNPPTPSVYLNVVNPLIDVSAIDTQASYEITEFSRYLLELSVCDGFFTNKKPSSIAYASILVAMEYLSSSTKIKTQFGSYQLDKLPHVTELCAQRLRRIYRLAMSSQSEEEQEEESNRTVFSPTLVSEAYS